MTIIQILLILALIGFGLWAMNTYVPMAAGWKRVINIIAAVAVALWLLRIFFLGLWNIGGGRRYGALSVCELTRPA